MKVAVQQDPKFYEPQNIIPNGTILEVVKKWWHYGVLTAVHVIYNNRDILLWMADLEVVSI